MQVTLIKHASDAMSKLLYLSVNDTHLRSLTGIGVSKAASNRFSRLHARIPHSINDLSFSDAVKFIVCGINPIVLQP